MSEKVSPINGVPLPHGKRFQQGDEQRETARKGGKASAAKRAKLKTLREELEILLADERTDSDGNNGTVQSCITSALIKQALDGNTKAFEIIRDTLGQKPVEHMEVSTPDFSALDAITYGNKD